MATKQANEFQTHDSVKIQSLQQIQIILHFSIDKMEFTHFNTIHKTLTNLLSSYFDNEDFINNIRKTANALGKCFKINEMLAMMLECLKADV